MAKRDDIVLATKFLPRTPHKLPEGSAEKRQSLNPLTEPEESGDGLYRPLHLPHLGFNTPIIDVLEALHTAVTAGKDELLVFQTAMPGSWRRRTPL